MQDLTRRFRVQIASGMKEFAIFDDSIAFLEQQTADVFIINPRLHGFGRFSVHTDVLKSREKKIVVTSPGYRAGPKKLRTPLPGFLDETPSHGGDRFPLNFDAWDDIHLIRNADNYPETRVLKSIYV